MAQVINAHVCNALFLTDVGSNLEIFALFFFLSLFVSFFCSPFYYLFSCQQEKPSCRFKPPNNASQICWLKAGFDIFLHLTNRHGRILFLLDWTILCKLLVWFVIKLCLKPSSILQSLRWMAWKRTRNVTRTNSFKYANFRWKWYISIRSSVGKTLDCWPATNQFSWFNAGWDIFPTLDNPSWMAFLFFPFIADYC